MHASEDLPLAIYTDQISISFATCHLLRDTSPSSHDVCFSLMFGRRVTLCILVFQWCLINPQFSHKPCKIDTHSSRSQTFSNQALFLPLLEQLFNLCSFN
jgi:hypothetical protein